MSDTEDPYAVSSDSEDDQGKKAPPPKINIEGRDTNLQQIKESLSKGEGQQGIKDEKTLAELAALQAKREELSRMKKDFEQGTVSNAQPNDLAFTTSSTEKPTGLDKQTLHQFKDMFENQPHKEFTSEQKELLDIQRSEADKQRVLAAFTQSERKEEEEPKNCCICDKVVYPVEKVVASKRLYHTNCFLCCKCGKKLSPTTFNSHQGLLYCRPHMLEVLHPERAVGTVGEEDDGDETPVHVDEDDEFAVTSKPKKLGDDVVRAGGTSIGDELQQLKSSLKDKKENWQSSANEANQPLASAADKQAALAEEIAAGKVKANLDKFISGDAEGASATEEDKEKRKQLEEIKGQVSEVKNKWKTGELEGAEVHHHEGASKDELEELKKGPKVRERFSERLQPGEGDSTAASNKSYDRSELENSSAAEARKSFLEGSAFQAGPVEKSAATELSDLKFTELNSFKDRFEKGGGDDEMREKTIVELDVQLKSLKNAFEKGGDGGGGDNPEDMSPEARAERKKKEIEAEFLRFKMARQLQAAKRKEEGGGVEESQQQVTGGDDRPELDVDIKMAGKAREKFKQIEQSASGASAPIPKSEHKPSKWDKKSDTTAEVVNKREQAADSSSDDEGEEAFDVKNLMNKFKQIEGMAPAKVERKLDELEALRVEAKNLRQRFECGAGADTDEQGEEKRRQLEEEFKRLKEERERAREELEAERKGEAVSSAPKEEVAITADHSSKMAAKFEKLAAKEAKKAAKGQMPQK